MGTTCYIDIWDSEPDTSQFDLRTERGREQEVIAKIKLDGGFTIFWATEFQSRAHAIDRLIKNGTIRRNRDRESGYPHCCYELSGIRKDYVLATEITDRESMASRIDREI